MSNLKPINFFDFRRLEQNHEVDGLIIAEYHNSYAVRKITRLCKLNRIKNVAVVVGRFNKFSIYRTDTDKTFIPYLETNLIDGCNLNCKGCTHFANLFSTKEFYPLENFYRDIRRVSECADVAEFHLLGGEPFLIKNLDEYISAARKFFPQTHFEIVTNGLLLPSVSKKIFTAIRENNFLVNISGYEPTMENMDKIKSVLDENKISYAVEKVVEKFRVFLSLHGGHNPDKSRSICCNHVCRFLRDGRIYKCPPNALSYRVAEKFAVKNFPKSTYADIYAPNFSSMFEQLDEAVEMCFWCSEQSRNFKWMQQPKPSLTDWLAEPNEIKLLED